MERLVILSKGDRIEVSDLPVYLLDWVEAKSAQRQSVENLAGGVSLEDSIHEVERISYSKLFNNAATTRRWQRAYWVGLSRSTFRYKLSKISSDYFLRARAGSSKK